jgi:hypothetical protein
MPPREGPRPKTGDHVPHLQLSDKSPPEFVDELMAWAVGELPNVREERTRISVSTTRALWLDESVTVAHEDAFIYRRGHKATSEKNKHEQIDHYKNPGGSKCRHQ